MCAKTLQELFAGQVYDILSADDHATIRQMPIQAIAYRSDAVKPGSIFFCIPGEKHDGHDFAADAAARGAVALVVEHPVEVDLPQIKLTSIRAALSLASAVFFDHPSRKLCLIGVTGTNGKTTTTFLVDHIIRHALAVAGASQAAQKTGLIGTVETRIGSTVLPSKYTTPESYDLQELLGTMVDEGLSHATMELSSHAIALDRVFGVSYRVVAFTNLTQDHLDFHKTMDAYFEAKAKIFMSQWVESRVIDIDTSWGRELFRRCPENLSGNLTSGFAQDADVRAVSVGYSADATQLKIATPQGEALFSYPLIGAFNVSNVLLAIALSLKLDIPLAVIIEALEQVPQIPGRLERVKPQGAGATLPIKVFVDYSHTPDSIEKALAALDAIKTNRTIIVFGCGGDRDATKRPLMGAAALAADYAVVTSDNPRSENPLAIIDDILVGMAAGQGRYEVEPDRRRAIARALKVAQPGDMVLIAGKGHEDYQLVGDKVLDFDDRLVAATELDLLAQKTGEKSGTSCS